MPGEEISINFGTKIIDPGLIGAFNFFHVGQDLGEENPGHPPPNKGHKRVDFKLFLDPFSLSAFSWIDHVKDSRVCNVPKTMPIWCLSCSNMMN